METRPTRSTTSPPEKVPIPSTCCTLMRRSPAGLHQLKLTVVELCSPPLEDKTKRFLQFRTDHQNLQTSHCGSALVHLSVFNALSVLLCSPYKVKVLPTHDASKVRASGPGLNTTGVPASLPVEFTIDAKDAGEGLLAVQITVSVSTPTDLQSRGSTLGLTRCNLTGP